MNPVAATNAFSGNFANNGHRNSIQLSNLCTMYRNAISKITFNIPQWNEILSKFGIRGTLDYQRETWKGLENKWGLSGLISAIGPGLAGGVGGVFFHVVILPSLHHHDDVIKWKHFPLHWPLCGEFTGHRWIPHTKATDAELSCFLWSTPK